MSDSDSGIEMQNLSRYTAAINLAPNDLKVQQNADFVPRNPTVEQKGSAFAPNDLEEHQNADFVPKNPAVQQNAEAFAPNDLEEHQNEDFVSSNLAVQQNGSAFAPNDLEAQQNADFVLNDPSVRQKVRFKSLFSFAMVSAFLRSVIERSTPKEYPNRDANHVFTQQNVAALVQNNLALQQNADSVPINLAVQQNDEGTVPNNPAVQQNYEGLVPNNSAAQQNEFVISNLTVQQQEYIPERRNPHHDYQSIYDLRRVTWFCVDRCTLIILSIVFTFVGFGCAIFSTYHFERPTAWIAMSVAAGITGFFLIKKSCHRLFCP